MQVPKRSVPLILLVLGEVALLLCLCFRAFNYLLRCVDWGALAPTCITCLQTWFAHVHTLCFKKCVHNLNPHTYTEDIAAMHILEILC